MIPAQRSPEQAEAARAERTLTVRDVLVSGPGLHDPWSSDSAALPGDAPLPADAPQAPRRVRLAVVAVLLLLAAVAGAAWGTQQSAGAAARAPLLLSVDEIAAPGSVWGTLSADLPRTSCGALVDWAVLSTPYAGVERSLPCADGSEVRARITLDTRDGQRRLQVRLLADAAALRAG